MVWKEVHARVIKGCLSFFRVMSGPVITYVPWMFKAQCCIVMCSLLGLYILKLLWDCLRSMNGSFSPKQAFLESQRGYGPMISPLQVFIISSLAQLQYMEEEIN